MGTKYGFGRWPKCPSEVGINELMIYGKKFGVSVKRTVMRLNWPKNKNPCAYQYVWFICVKGHRAGPLYRQNFIEKGSGNCQDCVLEDRTNRIQLQGGLKRIEVVDPNAERHEED